MKAFLLSCAAALILCGCAASPKHAETFGHWQVNTIASGNGTLCYAGTFPTVSKETVGDRAQPYIILTRRLSGKIEVSVSSGYTYLPRSKVTLTIDKKSYRLFFKGNVAWAKNDAGDKEILATLKSAKTLVVRGAAVDGGTSTDTYSTGGVIAALQRVKTLCP